jgi:hypothetical protein
MVWRLILSLCSRIIWSRPQLSLPQTPSVGLASVSESEHDCRMIAIALLFVRLLCDCFKSRRRLEAEVLVLRHQLNVLHRRGPRRLYMTWADRALFVWLWRRAPPVTEGCCRDDCENARHVNDLPEWRTYSSRSKGSADFPGHHESCLIRLTSQALETC